MISRGHYGAMRQQSRGTEEIGFTVIKTDKSGRRVLGKGQTITRQMEIIETNLKTKTIEMLSDNTDAINIESGGKTEVLIHHAIRSHSIGMIMTP